jgi:hypothetical protein
MKNIKIMTLLLLSSFCVATKAMDVSPERQLLDGTLSAEQYVNMIEGSGRWGKYAEMISAIRTADYSRYGSNLYKTLIVTVKMLITTLKNQRVSNPTSVTRGVVQANVRMKIEAAYNKFKDGVQRRTIRELKAD